MQSPQQDFFRAGVCNRCLTQCTPFQFTFEYPTPLPTMFLFIGKERGYVFESRTIIAFILLLLCCASRAQITFYAGDTSYSTQVAQLFLGSNFNVADPLINHSSIYVQQISATQDVTGLIVVTPTVNPIELPIRILQQNGAVAVVMVHDGIALPGRSIFNVDGSKGEGIHIPAFEIGSVAAEALPLIYPSEDTRINITIHSTGNEWLYIPENHLDVIFSVVIGAASAWCVGLAIYKLVLFARVRGRFTRGIPQTCLTLHLVANSIRLLYMVVDPLGFRRVWTYFADNILFTITFPITIVASLLMSLYWVEAMTSASLAVYPGLKKMKVPFIIFSVALGVLEIASDILRSAGVVGASLTVTITAIIVLICVAGMCIFYLIASTLLLKRMKASQTVSNKTNFLKRVTWLIIGSVVFFWLFFFCIVAFIFAEVSGSVSGWIIINIIALFALNGVSTCQILVFNPRVSKSSASSKGKKDASETVNSTTMSTIKSSI